MTYRVSTSFYGKQYKKTFHHQQTTRFNCLKMTWCSVLVKSIFSSIPLPTLPLLYMQSNFLISSVIPPYHTRVFTFKCSLLEKQKMTLVKQQHCNLFSTQTTATTTTASQFFPSSVHSSICPVKQYFVSMWDTYQPSRLLMSQAPNELLISQFSHSFRTHRYTQNSQFSWLRP